MDDELRQNFEDLINSEETNENNVQDFLEHHTELIPKKFMEIMVFLKI